MKKGFSFKSILRILGVIIAIVLFVLDTIQPFRYEQAIEDGYEVDAVVVEVKVENDPGIDGGPDSTEYTIYADYEVDGKEYKHVRVARRFDTNDTWSGDIIKVVVDPINPGKPMYEGGVLFTIATIIAIAVLVIWLVDRKKQRRKKEQNAQNN